MEIGKIIRKARLAAGYGLKTVSELTGVPASVQSKIELGDIASPSFVYIAKLAELYQLDMEGIYQASITGGDTPAIAAKASKSRQVPIISWVQAGCWTEAVTEQHDFEVITSPFKCSGDAYALKVKGDSMTSNPGSSHSFPEGSIIIVEPNVEARHRSFVVARLHGTDEVTFKRLNIDDNKCLQPLNPQYPIIPIDNHIHICGVVIGSIQLGW